MRSATRPLMPVLGLSLSLWMGGAYAVDSVAWEKHAGGYVGISGMMYVPDSSRTADVGWGGRFHLGMPIKPRLSFELSGYGYRYDAEALLFNDEAFGLVGDLVYGFPRENWTPFLLGGLGYIYENVLYDEEGALSADIGVGAKLPVYKTLSLRVDARYQLVFNDLGSAGNDPMGDILLSMGLQVPLGFFMKDEPPLPAPAPVQIDVRGCDLDCDQDGVDNAVDECPQTPDGVAVGINGCPPDEDDDGAPDYLDQCPETPRGLAVDAEGCVLPGELIVLTEVFFEFDSSDLTASSRSSLEKVAVALRGQPGIKVEVRGHTDARGSEVYNLELSQGRASVVRNYLVSKGVPGPDIIARGYGESQPVASNETEEGRANNRRVELKVIE